MIMEQRKARSRSAAREALGTTPARPLLLLLPLLQAIGGAVGFDPEWLRPRYHYGNESLLVNYGGGDVTDAIFLNGAWFVAADCTSVRPCNVRREGRAIPCNIRRPLVILEGREGIAL